jgi:hypothetical protein
VTVNLEYVYCPACDHHTVLYLGAAEPCLTCEGPVEADIAVWRFEDGTCVSLEGPQVEGWMR